MPTETLLTQMLQRRGTASEWSTANPVLKDGEIAIIEGTRTFKVGDGITVWNSLPTWHADIDAAYVASQISALINSAPSILDTLGELATQLQSDESAAAALTSLVALKAAIASPTFTGFPKAPTQPAKDNSTNIATTAYVDAAVAITRRAVAGTSYTLVSADEGQLIRCAAAGATTVIIPENAGIGWTTDAVISVYAAGAGGVTIVGGSITGGGTVTVRNNASPLTQYQEVSLRYDSPNEWVRVG